MKSKSTTAAAQLRRRAAKRLKAQKAKRQERSAATRAHLAEQLAVHQVELELQNEELRLARGELEAGLERYTQLFDFAPIGYCTLDAEGRVLEINHAAAALADEVRRRIVGRRFMLLIAPRHREAFQALLERVAGGEAQTGEFELLRVMGVQVIVRIRAAPLEGRAPAVLLAFDDITTQHDAEEKLRRLHAELRDADRRKDEFLAVLSHELRTPLSTLLIHGQILQQPGSDFAQTSRSGQAIERAARAQGRLIDDLLDVSRIIAGKLKMQFASTDVGSVARTALDVFAGEAAAKQIEITAHIDSSVPATLADASRLRQAIGNLLHNAIKFTPPGGHVRLAITVEGEQIRIQVRDNGVGIERDFLPRVFERFSQADRTSTRSQGGLGLGLSIVRHVVEGHSGTVQAASAGTGKGSTFSISLPILAPIEPKIGALPMSSAFADIGGARLLVVEDDAGTRSTLTQVLLLAGAEVRAADGAGAALAQLDEFRPDVLVCDIAMPGQDGCELLRQIRVRGTERGGDVPALALTAFAGDEDRRRTRAAGFQMHVVKPVDVNRLLGAVAALLHPEHGTGGGSATRARPMGPPPAGKS